MSVFTVFFCGTCSNSYDFIDGEVVSTLARNHPGREFVDWIICDGPGAGIHKSDTEKKTQKALGRWHNGTQTAMMAAEGIEAEKARKPGKVAGVKAHNMDLDTKWTAPGEHRRSAGITYGSGWEENVEHTIAVILGEAQWNKGSDGVITPQALQEQQVRIFRKSRGPITTVNAIGWSRGAVTCAMLANALANSPDPRLNQIRLNIFAIDPVPGPGQFDAHRVLLPKTVDRYFGVYARNELKAMFRPSLPAFQPGARAANFQVLLMPGVHATPSGDPYARKANQQTSGKVTRHLAEQCLARWGTPLNQKLGYSDLEILKGYDDMLRHLRDYRGGKKYESRKIRVGTNKKTPIEQVGQFRTGEELDVFVNWHHREVFERHYRVVADHLFGVHGFRRGPSVSYRTAMIQLRAHLPNIHAQLSAYQNEHNLSA